ncbi:MAG: biopolymer transporter ExbD [Opitutales bacterium]|nr:biopolymer transporter ExbD [Opitutales bacterium]
MSEINVTPLLDMCFCLLIIFMISTPVLEQTTVVNLPVASESIGKAIETSPKIEPVIVSLNAEGRYFIGSKEVLPEALLEEFSRIASMPEDKQPVVRVRADGSLLVQQLISLFDMAKEQGISKVSFDTELK